MDDAVAEHWKIQTGQARSICEFLVLVARVMCNLRERERERDGRWSLSPGNFVAKPDATRRDRSRQEEGTKSAGAGRDEVDQSGSGTKRVISRRS